MRKQSPVSDKAVRYVRKAPYSPEPFVARLNQLLAERNESYRAAALKSGLDHQAVAHRGEEAAAPHPYVYFAG